MLGDLLPEGWQWVTVKQVQHPSGRAIVSGPFGSNIGTKFFVASGVPLIRGNNLTTDMTRFIDSGFVYITEEKAYELRNCEARPGDLIFTAAGTLGQVGIIPDDTKYPRYIISNKQMRARLNPEVILPLFAFYWLASQEMVEYIQQRNTGSSVPLINLSVLRQLPIPLPPLNEQRAIARILGTLDDKIKLNRRMSHTLEEMARAIFKSWFVDFDPVIAKAEGRQPYGMNAEMAALFPSAFQDSEIGPIPMGWQVGRVGDVAQNIRRGVSPNDVQSETPYIGLEHMPRKSITLAEWGHTSDVISNKFAFNKGEILFGKLRPYFHKVGVAPVDGVCSTDVLVVAPKQSEWFGFVLGHLASVEFINYVDAGSEGTRMPRTNWDTMARYDIVIPSQQVASVYSKMVSVMISKIHEAIRESRTLAAIRDALLPKLLSGEIRVKDAADCLRHNG